MKASNSASSNIKIKEKNEIYENFLTLDNERNENHDDPYKLLSEKIDSTKTKTPKLITTIDNISQLRKKKYVFKPPRIKLPLIKTKQLLTEADLIVKKGKKIEGMAPLYIPVDMKIKKSVEINLRNKLIKNINEKRQEIKDNEKKYINNINKRNEDYKREYKKYLNLVEMEQKKQKEEDEIYNALKLEMNEKEKILINEFEKNKILNKDIKRIINEILSYKKYGQFIHKIFGSPFIFNFLKFDGKNYFKIADEIINIYENNEEDNKFYEMLASQGLYYFFMKWSNMESKIQKELDKNNEIIEELQDINTTKKNDIDLLKSKIEIIDKDKKIYDKNKKEESTMVKEFKNYHNRINDDKKYIEFVLELNNLLSEEYNIQTRFNNNNINKIDDEDSLYICKDTMKLLKKKEEIVTKYLKEINDIFDTGKEQDIQLIQKIINERKKLNIRVKQKELNKLKENSKRKNVFKSMNAQKIIFKGRKIPQKYPLFKNLNKNKNKNIDLNEKLISEYKDYICYSEDDD